MPTLLTMRTAVLREADLQLGQVDSDDVDALLNSELAALDELLIEVYQGWRVSTATLVIAANTDSVALPATFFQAVDLEEYATPSSPRQLPRVEFMERNASDWGWYVYGALLYVKPTSRAPGTYRLWFVPSFTLLALDADTYDVPNGFEQHAILGAAIRLRNMQELSASGLEERRKVVGERLQNAARKRQGRRKVRDVRGGTGGAWRDDDLVK
jgi:hypothetical protein